MENANDAPLTPAQKKKIWYEANKNTEAYKESMRRSRAKYYYANREATIQKVMERYRKKQEAERQMIPPGLIPQDPPAE